MIDPLAYHYPVNSKKVISNKKCLSSQYFPSLAQGSLLQLLKLAFLNIRVIIEEHKLH